MSDDRFAVTRTVTLKKGEGRNLKAGGLWVYDNEIAAVAGGGENGTLAVVKDFDGYPMGIGVHHPRADAVPPSQHGGYGRVPSGARARSVGISEEDRGHFLVPRDLRRGRLAAGHRGGQVLRCACNSVAFPRNGPV